MYKDGARILGERLAHAVTQLPSFPAILRAVFECL
jgi:hypothetical protein